MIVLYGLALPKVPWLPIWFKKKSELLNEILFIIFYILLYFNIKSLLSFQFVIEVHIHLLDMCEARTERKHQLGTLIR